MAKFAAIVQARRGSVRLPDKMMKTILGREVILRFLERIEAAHSLDLIIVATTDRSRDDRLVRLIETHFPEVGVFRGSEGDVLDRTYRAAVAVSTVSGEEPVVVRMTPDCPLLDPRVIDLHIEEFSRRDVDYLSSRIHKRTWPHGMELEVFTFASLKEAWLNAAEPFEREHVTPFIYRSHAHRFRLFELSHADDLSRYRFTLDYPEDLRFIDAVYRALYPRSPLFSLTDIMTLLEDHPEIVQINAMRVDPRLE